MEKRRNNNRKRKNNKDKQSAENRVILFRTNRSIIGKTVRRQVNLQYSVYAVYNYTASQTFYSFSPSLTQGTSLNYANILNDCFVSPEFIAFANQYSLCRIQAVSLKPVNSCFNSTASDLPPFYLAPAVLNTPTSLTVSNVARGDNALENKVTSTQNITAMVTYRLPAFISGANGYPIAGSSTWMGCATVSSTGGLYLTLGYLSPPQYPSTVAASVQSRVCTVDVVFDVTFGHPVATV